MLGLDLGLATKCCCCCAPGDGPEPEPTLRLHGLIGSTLVYQLQDGALLSIPGTAPNNALVNEDGDFIVNEDGDFIII